jgi:BASS family bile acid:Na+ symporter
MHQSNPLKWVSPVCLWVGFLLPFALSRGVGMPMGRYPWVPVVHVALWVVGLVAGYLAFASEKKFAPATPAWIRVCGYITTIPANLVMLGLSFGYIYYPSIEKSTYAKYCNYMLPITLLVMGAQITNADWRKMASQPKPVGVSVLLRWLVMPLCACMLANFVLLRFLPQPAATVIAVGMVVLGTTPTGGASNTYTLISSGDLALSVTVTGVNTILAPFLQPFLIKLFIGKVTHVDTLGIFLDLLEMVLAPVIIGSIIGSRWPALIKRIKPALGPLAVVIFGAMSLGNMSRGTGPLLKQLWILPVLVVVCVVQGLIGLYLGYYGPKLFGFNHKQRVASCFEVGIENASLATVVAITHFSPLTAIPCILYTKLQHLLAASIFVSRFQKIEEREQAKLAAAASRVAAVAN